MKDELNFFSPKLNSIMHRPISPNHKGYVYLKKKKKWASTFLSCTAGFFSLNEPPEHSCCSSKENLFSSSIKDKNLQIYLR